MTHAQIANAIGQHLAGMPDCPPIVWPNKSTGLPPLPYIVFQAPSRGKNDIALAGGAEQRNGRIVAVVVWQLNDYSTKPDALAAQIEARFARGTLPDVSNGVVTIVQSQAISGYPTNTDWRVPVQIDWRA